METWLQDVRFALRGLRRDPLFTAFVVATLTPGIGEPNSNFPASALTTCGMMFPGA